MLSILHSDLHTIIVSDCDNCTGCRWINLYTPGNQLIKNIQSALEGLQIFNFHIICYKHWCSGSCLTNLKCYNIWSWFEVIICYTQGWVKEKDYLYVCMYKNTWLCYFVNIRSLTFKTGLHSNFYRNTFKHLSQHYSYLPACHSTSKEQCCSIHFMSCMYADMKTQCRRIHHTLHLNPCLYTSHVHRGWG